VNLWECDEPGCTSTATGVGGAAGLIAIGWFFEPGPRLLCPVHHPDKVPCDDGFPENAGKPCSLCRAEDQAEFWQNQINDHRHWPLRHRRRGRA